MHSINNASNSIIIIAQIEQAIQAHENQQEQVTAISTLLKDREWSVEEMDDLPEIYKHFEKLPQPLQENGEIKVLFRTWTIQKWSKLYDLRANMVK